MTIVLAVIQKRRAIVSDHAAGLDCADEDCAMNYNCQGMDYGIPFETSCTNCVDDDDDGLVDCDDSDCNEDTACMMVPLYGIPF